MSELDYSTERSWCSFYVGNFLFSYFCCITGSYFVILLFFRLTVLAIILAVSVGTIIDRQCRKPKNTLGEKKLKNFQLPYSDVIICISQELDIYFWNILFISSWKINISEKHIDYFTYYIKKALIINFLTASNNLNFQQRTSQYSGYSWTL